MIRVAIYHVIGRIWFIIIMLINMTITMDSDFDINFMKSALQLQSSRKKASRCSFVAKLTPVHFSIEHLQYRVCSRWREETVCLCSYFYINLYSISTWTKEEVCWSLAFDRLSTREEKSSNEDWSRKGRRHFWDLMKCYSQLASFTIEKPFSRAFV